MADSGVSPSSVATAPLALWEKSPAFLWALAVVGAISTLVAAAAEWAGHSFPGMAFWIALVCFAASSTLAIARLLEERTRRTLHFAQIPMTAFAHVVRQADGSETTQILADFNIFNPTGERVIVAHVDLRSPRSKAEILHQTIVLFGSGTMNPSAIRSKSGGHFRAHIILRENLHAKIKRRGATLAIFDGAGRPHKVKLAHLRLTP